MVSYTITHEAYLKIILHAAKHPHLPVNGVLLGKPTESDQVVLVEDAIPLLHHWTSLSPMMEIGLDLVSANVCIFGVEMLMSQEGADVRDVSRVDLGRLLPGL